MKKYHQVVEASRERLSELGEIESRTQFGGYALTVERVIFALINDDELYLRASEALQTYTAERPLEPFIFRKRGIPVSLNYFKVDDVLWHDREHLLALSKASLQAAREDTQLRYVSDRLKDLPNLNLSLEIMLHKVGICSIKNLTETGAKQCWLRLRTINKNIGLQTLLALAGAISGHHQAALPAEVKAELSEWYRQTLKNIPSR